MEICPYMGSHWDSETPYTAPDSGNRCFARSEPVRVLLLFSKEVTGARIGRIYQHSNCYGDFRSCGYFRSKKDRSEDAQVSPGSAR
jgi:hypothetical protein